MTTVRLGEIVTSVGGGTPARGNPSFYGGSIPWVTPKDMKHWQLGDSQVRITEAGLANSAARLIPVGSVLIVVRSGVLKRRLPVALTTAPVAINQDMRALIPGPHVDARYLAHLVRARSAVILGWVRATTADNFPFRRLLDLEISLPPLCDQRRVAALLDLCDKIRQSARRSLSVLRELEGSGFAALIHDSSRSQKWPKVRIDKLARVVRGASPRPAGDPRYFGGDIPWLKISDVTATDEMTVTRIKETVTRAGAERSVRLAAGTLIITNSATVGIPKFIGIETCIHDGFIALLDIDTTAIDARFLYSSLLLRREEIVRLAPQGTQKNLNTSLVKSIEVQLPPMYLQANYGAVLDCIEHQATRYRARLDQLDGLVASLQHRASNGEL